MHINKVSKVSSIFKKSCKDIEENILRDQETNKNEAAILNEILATLFKQLQNAGYSTHLNNFLESILKTDQSKCLQIAKKGINSFKESNENLQDITHTHTIEIERITEENKDIDISEYRRRFSCFQQDLLSELQRANGVINNLEREVEELQKESNIDPLTKIYNRRALDIHCKELLKRTEKANLDIAILMIDIDNFKKVNDTFGHIAGDKVLIFLAKLFRSAVREYDKAYRYGGEEFVIILNRSDKESAIRVAERILEIVRKNRLIYKGQLIQITLSIGLSQHQKGDTAESMIERADAALYQAKHDGKDRLVIR